MEAYTEALFTLTALQGAVHNMKKLIQTVPGDAAESPEVEGQRRDGKTLPEHIKDHLISLIGKPPV